MNPGDRELAKEEAIVLYAGRCPIDGTQLYEGPHGGLAMNVKCEKDHLFWVSRPFTPLLLEKNELVRRNEANV